MRTSFAAALATVLLVAGAPGSADAADTTAAQPEAAAAAGYGGECRNAGATRTRVYDISKRVGIGYARAYTLGPGDVKKKWKHVTRRSRLKASYNAKAELSAEASVPLRKVLRIKAEGKLNVDLRAFGSYYKEDEVTIFNKVKNNSNRNQLRVAYKANYFYVGSYRYKYCKYLYPGMNRWETTTGKWRSGQTIQSGTLLCFSNYPGAVAKAVARSYCN
jgi:hypothetical protein